MNNTASDSHKKEEIIIRRAKPKDSPQIFQLLLDLAVFLKSGKDVVLTPEEFHDDLFCEPPKCQCVVATTAQESDTIIGYSLFYPVYSAWKGFSLYMEDLFVKPEHRRKGVGKLLWQKVTQIGLDMGCKGLRLTVENWNKTAKDMYTHHGCVDLTEALDEHPMYLNKAGMEKLVQEV
ncbi:hypothetical protein PoB_000049500 [Plakobranchus ocellatus]|uniref:N-acetyltransferase domain-containing protein n=1 Tax=Plakobranchus ocellatus TaxID=259542 RepID=A0AAV3XUB6_9GAST|nr:hypothetical protein PoB_000049500 [Plakobranchus ocellatus]